MKTLSAHLVAVLLMITVQLAARAGEDWTSLHEKLRKRIEVPERYWWRTPKMTDEDLRRAREEKVKEMDMLFEVADEALLVKGKCLHELGEYDKAIEVYEDLLRRFPQATISSVVVNFISSLPSLNRFHALRHPN